MESTRDLVRLVHSLRNRGIGCVISHDDGCGRDWEAHVLVALEDSEDAIRIYVSEGEKGHATEGALYYTVRLVDFDGDETEGTASDCVGDVVGFIRATGDPVPVEHCRDCGLVMEYNVCRC